MALDPVRHNSVRRRDPIRFWDRELGSFRVLLAIRKKDSTASGPSA